MNICRECVDMVMDCRYNVDMNTTHTTTDTITTCEHATLMVTSGIVRCSDCLDFFPDHPDSDHRPGLIEANQSR